MNLRILIFFLLSSLTLSAQNKAITLTITNAPVVGNTVVVNANTRTWTNAQTSTTILTNGIINNSTTNLYSDFGLNPVAGVRISYASSNAVTFTAGTPGAALTVTVGGSWASLSSSTNATLPATNLSVPAINSSLTAVDRTNVWSQAIRDLSDYGTGQSFATNAPALAKYSTLTTGQTLSNKTVRASRIENSTFTNGPIYGTSGAISNLIAHSLISTNGQNRGNAFSSPGTASGSEQFGAGAAATGTNSTAGGNSAQAKAENSVAVGYVALVEDTATNGIAIGQNAVVDLNGENGIAIGNTALANGKNTTAIGTLSSAGHDNSIAIGSGATTTTTNQLMLGTASINVRVNNELQVQGHQTNTTFTGTNQWRGDIAFPFVSLTGLANTNNLLDPAQGVYLTLSGPSVNYNISGISGGRPGRTVWIRNKTGFTIRFSEESGTVGDTNRISTGGGDLVKTNLIGWTGLVYNPSNRWEVLSPSF